MLQPLPTMRPVVLVALFVLLASPLARGAQSAEMILNDGLREFVTNGPEAGIRAWFSDRPELAAQMTKRVLSASSTLGSTIDSEVVATQRLSTRVTRVFVAIYFARSPLWIRLERYDNGEKSFFLPLKCSTDPDEILPGYITDFNR